MGESSLDKNGDHKQTGDIYDEEFRTNLQLAKGLVKQLSHREKTICKKWITKLVELKSKDPLVKKNRNAFFQYFLEILHKTILEREHHDYPQYDERRGGDAGFMSRWSTDKRTYVAAKPLPGRGTLIYMAVSKDPLLGWDIPNKKA